MTPEDLVALMREHPRTALVVAQFVRFWGPWHPGLGGPTRTSLWPRDGAMIVVVPYDADHWTFETDPPSQDDDGAPLCTSEGAAIREADLALERAGAVLLAEDPRLTQKGG